jgi:hypothetical protein
MSKVRDDLRVLAEKITESIFQPTKAQREAKAAFWAVRGEPAYGDVLEIVTMGDAMRITGDNRLKTWWGQTGFVEWFSNSKSFHQRAEYLADLAMDTIEEILLNPDTNPNARINAAKIMMEVANKLPKNQPAPRVLDKAIDQMDMEQLRAFIAKHTPKALTQGKAEEENGSPAN